MDAITWFNELRRTDTSIAGGKGAKLGERVGDGSQAPPGFVITADAYLASMAAGHVRDQLAATPGDRGDATAARRWDGVARSKKGQR